MAELLTIYEFGRQLIKTRDLDPVYVIVNSSDLKEAKLKQWLLAYFCFYHCGTASWIVDQDDYWEAMRTAAASKDYIRSSERRHFRGELANKSVLWLEAQGVEKLFRGLRIGPTKLPASLVMSRVKTWYNFGNWIAFKVADMLERINLMQIQFQPNDIFNIFEAPREGARLMAQYYSYSYNDPYMWAYEKLSNAFRDLDAPPTFDRQINIQEIETVLCKWKSHRSGRYEVGKDIAEVKHGLERYPVSKTASHLLEVGKKERLW